jgi:serine/threonine-protein kinase
MSADRNLLFGILALQTGFISRDALVEAMKAWVTEKTEPLGRILVERGVLRDDCRSLLDALVDKHLELHGPDSWKSLASVVSADAAIEELRQITDGEQHANLLTFPATLLPAQHPRMATEKESPSSSAGDTCVGCSPTTAATGAISASTIKPRYRVVRPHARGDRGQVFVAIDEELGREVALKEIQLRYADHPENQARFLLEGEVTGNLEHPGIVPVYGMGRYADGRPYYAMRFIRGDSLANAIRRFHQAEGAGCDPDKRTLELRQLLRRFVDVCNAVAYAHSRGVLHRDLKPANAMLGKYGETLVVDWGVAKTVGGRDEVTGSDEGLLRPSSVGDSTATQMGSVLGTPQYMPPEQAAGHSDRLCPASDVYSLGATLYHLLTGQAPFEGDDAAAIMHRVQEGNFRPPRQVKKEVPAALEAVCLKAMKLEPEDRYASAQALADEIEHWLADEPVAAYREPWTVRAGRWVRRHRTKVTGAVAGMGAAAMCLAVATVLLAAANQREREAGQREREAKNAVSRERDEVNKQNERADINLEKARKAVEDFCTNVAEDTRLKRADLHGLRKKLLETAVPFYEEFVQQKADDPKLQADRGRAYWRLALIRAEMGEADRATADYRRMEAVFAELARLHPDVPSYRLHLAISHDNLGSLRSTRGQFKEAEEALRQALALRQKLAGDFPDIPGYRRDLAVSHNNLGSMLQDRGQFEEAEKAYRQALALRQMLAGDFPAISGYREDLGITYFSLGKLARVGGQPEASMEWYARAIGVLQPLLEIDSRRARSRFFLRSAHAERAAALSKLARHVEAIKDLDCAIALDDGRTRLPLQLHRALSLAHAGNHGSAVAEANNLASGKNVSGLTLYYAACVCALASGSVKNDARLSEQYATRAIELLGKARDSGYFKDAATVTHMKVDNDLDSLRSRDDFKNLLTDLEKNAGKSK